MRKLVTIRQISNIEEIGADNIVLAFIEGWQTVVPRDQFSIGDYCVFFEPDAILPADAEWVKQYASFMEREKWTVRTKKFNKFRVISQGMALPLSAVFGIDISSSLGVEKKETYEKAEMGDTSGKFPYWIAKTDELRVQSDMWLYTSLLSKPYYITQKLDGMSCTAYIEDGKLVCASRNFIKKDSSNAFYTGVRASGADKFLLENPHLALQGEICGTNIQKNRLHLKDIQFFIFNIFNRNTGKRLNIQDYPAGLQYVPILFVGDSFNFSLEQLENIASKVKDLEGIVVRSQDQKISFKIINPEYIL